MSMRFGRTLPAFASRIVSKSICAGVSKSLLETLDFKPLFLFSIATAFVFQNCGKFEAVNSNNLTVDRGAEGGSGILVP
jgi:hypothetical protein